MRRSLYWAPIAATIIMAGAGGAVSAKPAAKASQAVVRAAIDSHYARYRTLADQPSLPSASLPYSAELKQLLDRAGGNPDYDGFCQCQDYDEKRFTYSIRKLSLNGDRATADIRVSAMAGHRGKVRLLLLCSPDGIWQLDDMIDEEGSLKSRARSATPGDWGSE